MASTTYSKDKGRAWETAVAKYFAENGFPGAERRRQAGANDRGDFSGLPLLAGEAKHERSYKLPEWVREAELEARNAGVPFGVVLARQNGKPDPADGFAIMSIRQFVVVWQKVIGFYP